MDIPVAKAHDSDICTLHCSSAAVPNKALERSDAWFCAIDGVDSPAVRSNSVNRLSIVQDQVLTHTWRRQNRAWQSQGRFAPQSS